MSKFIDRTGEKIVNNRGEEFTIIKYTNNKNIDIQLECGLIIKNRCYIDLKRGKVYNPFRKGFYGVGYLGDGKYNKASDKKVFIRWVGMIRRCYSEKEQEKHPTYKDVTVCEEWHNFQNFAEWFENNYIEVFELDKDILVKGNKIYSPETCCFVPQEINLIFKKGGQNKYPTGIYYHKRDRLYNASLPKNKQGKRNFKTLEEAFQVYKTAKETYIKEVADKWKNQITPQTYQAMYNYSVEITD